MSALTGDYEHTPMVTLAAYHERIADLERELGEARASGAGASGMLLRAVETGGSVIEDLRARLRSSEEAREGLRAALIRAGNWTAGGGEWQDADASGRKAEVEQEINRQISAALSSPSTGCKTCNGARQINVKEGDPRHFKWVRKPCAACSPSTGLYEALKLARGALENWSTHCMHCEIALHGREADCDCGLELRDLALAAIKDYEGGRA